MIDWLVDLFWGLKHRSELAALDAEMDALDAWRRRLDDRMEEMYGPDWREKAEKRFANAMHGTLSAE